MPKELLNITMHDGSRHFGDLPQTVLWYALRDHVSALPGAAVTRFLTDNVTEAWIDFTYRHQEFSINDQFGSYWFFVNDPACPDEIMQAVLDYCAQVLGK